MASERRSGRQAKIIKKEPTFAIASSVAEQEQDTPENWIEIDLAKALPGISITESMHIIIEGVPDGARFSMGRNNGDKTWSLEPWDLPELSYLPPPGHSAEDQNFFVRLLTYDPDGYQIAWLGVWGAPIRVDPNWNKGDYYGRAEPFEGLAAALALVTLHAKHWTWTNGPSFGRKWTVDGQDPASCLTDCRFAAGRK